MHKFIGSLILIVCSTFSFSQTENKNLNEQLGEMKKYFLAGDYDNFAEYTYPKVIEMMGGRSNMVNATKQAMDKMKNDGFTFKDLSFKDPSSFLKKDGELQCTLTQQLTMNTPQGKIESEYTLIALSSDDGLNWTFIDTSGKDKQTMLKYFPNLHKEIIIKPRKQK
ncbi:hypothetical protein ACEZ3G_00765 [Maribacter algicola]|uniref:Uncharacterized protein n=1 Tax=Meishania litoralis TaxID=3434685 RepID=A0ACC7LGA2_9FLAO